MFWKTGSTLSSQNAFVITVVTGSRRGRLRFVVLNSVLSQNVRKFSTLHFDCRDWRSRIVAYMQLHEFVQVRKMQKVMHSEH
jgi:hypothetical protein